MTGFTRKNQGPENTRCSASTRREPYNVPDLPKCSKNQGQPRRGQQSQGLGFSKNGWGTRGKNVTPKLRGKPGQHPAVHHFSHSNVLACNFFWAFPTFRHSQMKDLSKIQTAHLISLEFHDHSVNGRVGTLFYRLESSSAFF